ncbi:hypothetical protein ACLOJK_020476 [Asimina triloba]
MAIKEKNTEAAGSSSEGLHQAGGEGLGLAPTGVASELISVAGAQKPELVEE